MQKTERMRELIQTITTADEAYYKFDDPIMTDLEYDQLYDELAALEQETGIILSSSPTQRVSGEVLESLSVVRHTRPMLSADKRKSIADIHSFLGGRQAVLSWKLDGLTLVLRYEEGRLVQAITRGDGLQGEDVTHTVRVMKNVPLTNGDFDTAAECRYTVPSATSIGMLYQGLVLSTMKDDDAAQAILDVFSSFITDEISDFNSNVYYTNPDYLRCSYLEGKMLA